MKSAVNQELKQRFAPAMAAMRPEQLCANLTVIDGMIVQWEGVAEQVKRGQNDQFTDAECSNKLAEFQAMREAVVEEQEKRGLIQLSMAHEVVEQHTAISAPPKIKPEIIIATGVITAVGLAIGAGLGIGLTV